MTTTDSNLNQLIINELTQAEYDAATINPNELYIVKDGVMQSSDVINALGYTPVNKAGDTMTGTLKLDRANYVQDESPCIVKFDDVIYGTNPSTNEYPHIIQVQDGNSDIIGSIEYQYYPTGERAMSFQAKKAGEDVYSTIRAIIDSNDNASCTFPRTDCVDGQWVNINQGLISSATPLDGSTNLTYRVDLPDDGHKYEVMFRGSCFTGSTVGSDVYLVITGNEDTLSRYIGRARAGAAGTFATIGTAIVTCSYVASGSTNLTVSRSTSWNGSCTELRVIAYRRIGTNT